MRLIAGGPCKEVSVQQSQAPSIKRSPKRKNVELYNKKTLTDVEEYHAAEALIAEYMYRNDPEAEVILDKLFVLVSEYEDKNAPPPTPYDELDFEDPYEDVRDWS